MQKELVTVVIPVYKPLLTPDEVLSIEQCCKTLYQHPVTLVTHKELDIADYVFYFNKYNIRYRLLFFPEKYFSNITGYNELLLSPVFYRSFSGYTYILIYQLDAYVFRDDLTYWCNKGYDYIGAPWFKRVWRFRYSKKLRAIGNGGFSLRKVQSALNVLEHTGKFKPWRYFFTFHNSVLLKLKKLPLKEWKDIRISNSLDFFISVNRKTEDQFWCLDTQNSYVNYNVASIEDGIKFAFECKPSLLYELNDEQLPFGCHAWNRYEPEFWNPFITP